MTRRADRRRGVSRAGAPAMAPVAAYRFAVNPTVVGDVLARGLVFRHELAHVALGAADDRSPVWLMEGAAEYVARSTIPPTNAAGSPPTSSAPRRHARSSRRRRVLHGDAHPQLQPGRAGVRLRRRPRGARPRCGTWSAPSARPASSPGPRPRTSYAVSSGCRPGADRAGARLGAGRLTSRSPRQARPVARRCAARSSRRHDSRVSRPASRASTTGTARPDGRRRGRPGVAFARIVADVVAGRRRRRPGRPAPAPRGRRRPASPRSAHAVWDLTQPTSRSTMSGRRTTCVPGAHRPRQHDEPARRPRTAAARTSTPSPRSAGDQALRAAPGTRWPCTRGAQAVRATGSAAARTCPEPPAGAGSSHGLRADAAAGPRGAEQVRRGARRRRTAGHGRPRR